MSGGHNVDPNAVTLLPVVGVHNTDQNAVTLLPNTLRYLTLCDVVLFQITILQMNVKCILVYVIPFVWHVLQHWILVKVCSGEKNVRASERRGVASSRRHGGNQ